MEGGEFEGSPAKRQKIEYSPDVKMNDDPAIPAPGSSTNGHLGGLDGASDSHATSEVPQLRKGEAPVKAEFRIAYERGGENGHRDNGHRDDDEAEKSTMIQSGAKDAYVGKGDRKGGKDKKKERGQNKGRKYGNWGDAIKLCSSRVHAPEFSPEPCSFGEKCKLEHDLRKYLKDGKSEDIPMFGGVCPVWDARGVCNVGWRCRFLGSHSTERTLEDGRKELVLVEDEERKTKCGINQTPEQEFGTVNVVSAQDKIDLSKRKVQTPRADQYSEWLSKSWNEGQNFRHNHKLQAEAQREAEENATNEAEGGEISKEDHRAAYIEPPFLPSEKRRLYYGPETPVLAPLTTQGNLPYRRLCVELGAQVTWSEMAMGMPLIQGNKGEWALMKAHQSEITPPQSSNPGIVAGYDNSKDLKFGVQIAANKPWLAFKTTEILTNTLPHLRAIDLNCGCPIDLVYKDGAGSALLDSQSKLEKMLRGMNALSGSIPITVKIRMGTKDSTPTADSLINRLVLGGHDAQQAGLGPCGVASITLHGRSRQQRYTRLADWGYIADCAALVDRIHKDQAAVTDTAAEPDARHIANGGKVFFIGNGDCFSYEDYYEHIDKGKVDSVMAARGALIKPWLFEEIAARQHLDKSASERLTYVEKFVKYGLENWGSDEAGVGTTRRFLLEWLSFSCRYVPIGILEHLPPKINERPPRYRGRNELETLLSSDNYRDWIKISEMFLGPAHKDFHFAPKHKSNSYEINAEG